MGRTEETGKFGSTPGEDGAVASLLSGICRTYDGSLLYTQTDATELKSTPPCPSLVASHVAASTVPECRKCLCSSIPK